MKKIKISFHSILKWSILLIICLLLVLLIVRLVHVLEIKKIENKISRIHLAELSVADVSGDNLPKSNISDNSDSLLGSDSNNNMIRDDVEIEIFKKYPSSEKIRAALLQYAMTLQMEFGSDLDKDVVLKIINEQSRANTCIANTLFPRVDEESSRSIKDVEEIENHLLFVKEKQFNTEERKKIDDNFYKYLDENIKEDKYIDKMLNEKDNPCDIDISILKN